jgi:TolB protein
MNADGSGRRRLTRRRRVGEIAPAWSPDGRRIVFGTSDPHETSIVVVNLDGSGERTIARQSLDLGLQWVGEPAWSPDGRLIAYTRYHFDRDFNERPDLYVVRPDGTGRRRIARDAGSPAWSPDGRRLAVSSVRDRNGMHQEGSDEDGYDGEIYVMDADGRNQTRLTHERGNDVSPAWSPDGTRIAFASDRNFPSQFGVENDEIYSVAPDGSCLTWLTNGAPASAGPAWRPPASGSTDPGGCGATSRPAGLDVDTSRARAVKRYPVYWLGPRFGDSLLGAV